MELADTLHKAGLSSKEIQVYLACLRHGPETIAVMARHAGLKRSTMYHVLESLIGKGFVVLTSKGKRTVYDAEKPQKLLQTLKEREKELESALPELEQLRGTTGHLPRTYIYEGANGIEKVYSEIYQCMEGGQEVAFLTSIADLQDHAPFAIDRYYAVLRKKPDAKVRELILHDLHGKKYVRWVRKQGFHQALRLLPLEYPIQNDLVLYGNKAALFSFKRRPSVTVIDDEDITQTLKNLYQTAWLAGKNVN